MKPLHDEPEFSRPVAVDKIPATGLDQALKADEKERQALAGRFGLLDVPRLSAALSVQPARAERAFVVTGRLEAEVVQQCVATLEPLPVRIEQAIDVLYVAPEEEAADAAQIDLEAGETEPIVDGIIDLGELCAQYLGAALDPWPRKPGVAYVEAQYGVESPAAKPFAKLVDLKKKPESKDR